jgi:zinc transporter 11
MTMLLSTVLLSLAASSGSNKPVLAQRLSHCPAEQEVSNPQWWPAILGLRGGSTGVPCPPPPTGLLESVKSWHPVLLAFMGTFFGWFMTALGSAAVAVHYVGLGEQDFRKVLDFMLGVSGGVMTAASYWSLLAPALEFAELQGWGQFSWVPVALGFLSGGVLLQGTDYWLQRMQGSLGELDLYKGVAVAEGSSGSGRGSRRSGRKSPSTPTAVTATADAASSSRLRRLLMLIIAITIHNFPEGMAVGVAFGAIGTAPGATFASAATLALGIGIQNFPEGLAVSMPLLREGVSPIKSFWYGQLSGLVEPIGGVLGAAFVHYCRPMLPYTMSLAAGAMIFVVCDSLVPEMSAHGNKGLAMQGLMLGFVVMMILDVTLG